MRFRVVSSFVVLAVSAAVLFAVTAAGADSSASKTTYIVQLLDQPVVAYEGGIPGHPATKPAGRNKVDPNAPHVENYVEYLDGKHDETLARVGGGEKVYDYEFVFNGFSASLTEGQAQKLAGMKDVVAVTPDRQHLVDTATTPEFLGLAGHDGFWQQTRATGENVIIGMLDTGYWPESLSFSDRPRTSPLGRGGRLAYRPIPGWHGICQAGEDFPASTCNQKVIGARFFSEGRLAGLAIPEFEFLSPRDWDGHGTHTASTAGGNFGVQPTREAAAFSTISGMAPRARLSIYKVCFELPDQSTATCFSSDSVAAIDQGVADGVDVMSYSIGGSSTNFLDPVQIAFFNAAAAGVFVSEAAGNSGPGESTVEGAGPWLTTVAASSHDRTGLGSVTIEGVTYSGASYAPAATTGTLADAGDSGLTGADPTQASQCFSDADQDPSNGVQAVLDPAKVANKIVLCDRGGNVLVDKSLAVKQAGGIGMVLTNVAASPANTFALIHSVPTVHVLYTAANYAALHAAADAAKTATIAKGTIVRNVPAPLVASFSGRGPLLAGDGDLLKPDVSAPGVEVLASVAPPGNQGRDFDIYSGTSMATPHVSGVAALLTELYPHWSPMATKSALMTTGFDLLTGADPFDQGAGHIDPRKAADPGLVYDSGFADWIAFICGTGQLTGALCEPPPAGFGSIDPSDLNVASIAIGDLAGIQTITRTVTNVGKVSETYTAAVTGLDGLTVDVHPSSFTIAPGASATYTVEFTRTSATLGAYATGFLSWNGDHGHVVRSPVAIRPVEIAAPLEVTGTGDPITYSVTSGFTGTLSFSARGLVPATDTDASVNQDPDQSFDPGDPTGTYSKDIAIPADQKLFRVGVSEDAITPSGTDLDVYLFLDGELVAAAADGDSNEMITVPNPDAGTYTVYVHGFATVAPSASFTLFEWQIGDTDAGNMSVPAATAVVTGQSVPVTLSFTGLAAETKYLGQVVYGNPAEIGTTIVSVNT